MTKLTEVSQTKNFVDTYFSDEKLSQLNLAEKPSGMVSYADLFSMKGIYAYYKLSDEFPYILLVGYDAAYSQEAIQNRLLPRLLQVVSIAVLVLFFLWLIKVRVIRPIVDLTEITADIARGVPYEMGQNRAPLEVDVLAMQIHRLSDYIEERKRVESELHSKLEVALSSAQRESVEHQNFTEE